MPRPRKCRRVCRMPDVCEFYPAGETADFVVLTVDEYETVRLIDREGFSQEQSAGYMNVARTTVQLIYDRARKKIADALVSGKGIRIEGGDYRLCDGQETECGCGGCMRHRMTKRKEDNTMRIAVTYDNGEIFGHFGHTEQFKFYDVEDGKITGEQVVGTNGSGHGALAGFLASNKVDALICGGIGMGAQNALAEVGIKLFGGASGNADEAVKALLGGQLAYDPDVHCDHHQHHDGDCGHDNCAKHNCEGNNI